jgi:membrane protein
MVLLFWFWISSLILLGAAQVNKIIEEASPLGKNYGQRTNPAETPDFEAMKPEPANP